MEKEELKELPIKTLLVYKKGEEENHKVCDFIGKNENKYSFADVEEAILHNNPFELSGNNECYECYEKTDVQYVIESVDMRSGKIVETVEVTVNYVLEINEMLFDLPKSKYSPY